MTEDKMSVDEMSVDKMTCFLIEQRLNKASVHVI